jgi:hypothetical protein
MAINDAVKAAITQIGEINTDLKRFGITPDVEECHQVNDGEITFIVTVKFHNGFARRTITNSATSTVGIEFAYLYALQNFWLAIIEEMTLPEAPNGKK